MPKRHWSREEIEILCNEYPSSPTDLLVELLGKSQQAIKLQGDISWPEENASHAFTNQAQRD